MRSKINLLLLLILTVGKGDWTYCRLVAGDYAETMHMVLIRK